MSFYVRFRRNMNERGKIPMKNILVIGGSAFVGRVFSIQISKNEENELHVVNRGNFPLNLKNVKQYKCDRHSPRMIAHLVPKMTFDVLIDFCAYNPGEIKSVLEALKGRFAQYIMISTASVYEPYDHKIKKEGDTVVSQTGGDRVSDYIYKKLQLEQETIDTCKKMNIPYTIFRPTFIYGPFNYSARESYFVELIARGHIVPVPINATAHFNMVYVFDVARALELCIGNEKAYNQIFNISAPEEVTYDLLINSFEQYNGSPFDKREVTVEEVLEQNIPLPFPLTEDELYDGGKLAKALDFAYTPFEVGMEKTYKIFYSLFIS
jgi:2'-hydroxyisoflavone reductase